MATTIINRTAELRNALFASNSMSNRQDIAMGVARRGGERMLFFTRREAPVGEYEPSYETARGIINHGRPSIRQHGITLDAGWIQESYRITNGATWVLNSHAPHAPWVLRGTEEHPISAVRGEALSFWHFKTGAPMVRGTVDHPGTRADNFILRAAIQNRGPMTGMLRSGARQAITPLITFFEGRSVPLIEG